MAIHSNQSLGTIEIKTMRHDIKIARQARSGKQTNKIPNLPRTQKETIITKPNTAVLKETVKQNLPEATKNNTQIKNDLEVKKDKQREESIKVFPTEISLKSRLYDNRESSIKSGQNVESGPTKSILKENQNNKPAIQNDKDIQNKTFEPANKTVLQVNKEIQNKEIQKSDMQKINQIAKGDKYREHVELKDAITSVKEKLKLNTSIEKPVSNVSFNDTNGKQKIKFMEEVERWASLSHEPKQ